MQIIGHQKVISLLERGIGKNAVSHAYLFSGPEHVGKFTVALDFAQKLTAGNAGINADLSVIAPEIEEKKGVIKKRDIKIEQIRDLRHRLSLSAGGRFRVAIIDEAERMNVTAQNALLKTLEEAQTGVVLILVAQDEKKILPTIISRCQRIRLGTVADEELKALVPEGVEKQEIIFWSLGRPGILKSLLADPAALSARREAQAELQRLSAASAAEKFAFAEKLGQNVDEAVQKLDEWLILLQVKIGDDSAGIVEDRLGAARLAERIAESIALLKDTNANARLLLENLFLEF